MRRVLLLFLLSSTLCFAGDKNFKVGVVDQYGAAIQAEVFARSLSSGYSVPLLSVVADRDGTAELVLKPGLYDLFVSANGFDPYARKIEVLPGKPFVLKVKMKVSVVGNDPD